MLRNHRISRHSRVRSFAPWALVAGALLWTAPPLLAQEVIEGKAILTHPAGKAVIEASKLLKAGKLGEVKKASVQEAREEWVTLSAEDQRAEAAQAAASAPDPKTLEAEIARSGILTNYGDSAMLRTASADGNSAIMAFVSLEGGTWRVTAGPKTIDTTPIVETAPALEGQAVLDHEIGKAVLAFAQEIAAGKFEAANELRSAPARAKRAAMAGKEREESDRYWKDTLPAPSALADQIRTGGKLTFEGEKAYLNISSNTKTENADGSTSYSSSSMSIPFDLDAGTWRVGD